MVKSIEVNNLTKRFGNTCVVDAISFYVGRGEVVGFLGPNGAGKTTTLQMLLGITKKTQGDISICGFELEKNREAILRRINFSSTYTSLHGRYTAYENLYIFSLLYEVPNPKKKILELLEIFDLSNVAHKPTRTFSSGQTTRLNLCKALINDPEPLLLDEPTASLDPDIAEKTRTLLKGIQKEKGMSMLYTSHNMNEVTMMCNRLIFLSQGKIIAQDTPKNLARSIQRSNITLFYDADEKKVEKLRKNLEKRKEERIHSLTSTSLSMTVNEQSMGETLHAITETGVRLIDIDIDKPTLEDVFLLLARGKDI